MNETSSPEVVVRAIFGASVKDGFGPARHGRAIHARQPRSTRLRNELSNGSGTGAKHICNQMVAESDCGVVTSATKRLRNDDSDY
jgi:hypothetical protein